jgi:putative cardiolipin synthase
MLVFVVSLSVTLPLFAAPPETATKPEINSLQLLLTSREAMQARIDLAFAEGLHNLDVSTYVILEDNVGLALMAAAVQTVRQGGRARIAFDAYESRLSPELIHFVLSEGVELKIFRPVVTDIKHPVQTLNSWRGINNRSHEKLFLIDSSSAVVGSSNLTEDYYLGARKRQSPGKWRFKDREILIHGPVVASNIQTEFDRKWQSSDFHVPVEGDPQKLDAAKTLEVSSAIESSIAQLKSMRGKKEFLQPPVATVSRIEYAADAATRFGKTQTVHSKIIALIDSAKESLVLENPYIVLPADFRHAIERAVKRGVQVQLFTNDPGGTDGGDVGMASVPDFVQLNKLGVQIHFFDLDYVFHGKLIIADHKNFFWGSYNFDNRSKSFNLENGIFFESAEIDRQLQLRRNGEAFRKNDLTVEGDRLFTVPAKRTCEELFSSQARDGYSTHLSPVLRMKKPFL